MSGAGSERFKMIRRNTLRHEVDGAFDDLEAFEDREVASSQERVTHQECILLNRVLSDKTKLPPVCIPPRVETTRKVSSRRRRRQQQQQQLTESAPAAQHDESAVKGIVRQITGAVQPVLSSLTALQAAPKQEMGGAVTVEQCQTLANYLSPSAGGQYLLPTACSNLLLNASAAADQADLANAYAENEKSGAYGAPPLKRRSSVMAKECFPPTVC